MRYILSICLGFAAQFLLAQNVHYFKAHMGPKMDKYEVVGNQNVKALTHLNVGAGVAMGKRFTENIFAEAGIYKNDYSAKFEVTTLDDNGEELKAFSDKLYPTFSTTQLSVLVGYRMELSEKWSWYTQGGIQGIVSKKLDREGSQSILDTARNESSGAKEAIKLITYSNGFGAGSLLFRGDVGVFKRLSPSLSIDVSLSGRFSTLNLNEFDIEYTKENSDKHQAKLLTNGVNLSLYIGLRYRINNYTDK